MRAPVAVNQLPRVFAAEAGLDHIDISVRAARSEGTDRETIGAIAEMVKAG